MRCVAVSPNGTNVVSCGDDSTVRVWLLDDEADATPSGADDEALVLHTSGTTSRPKVVPLMQRQQCE